MKLTGRSARICGFVWALVLAATSASAQQLIDLAPPPSTYLGQDFTGGWFAGVGARRSFIFEDVAPFALTSVDIEVNPSGTTTFTAALYQVTGVDTVGALLQSNSIVRNDSDRGFYNTPISFAFPGTGNRYLLDVSWNVQPSEATFYSFEGVGDFGEPIDPPYLAGPIRVIDGKDGDVPGDDNFIISHFRINVIPVPEPASAAGLALVAAFGLLGRVRS